VVAGCCIKDGGALLRRAQKNYKSEPRFFRKILASRCADAGGNETVLQREGSAFGEKVKGVKVSRALAAQVEPS
jgi:hypothetical protein